MPLHVQNNGLKSVIDVWKHKPVNKGYVRHQDVFRLAWSQSHEPRDITVVGNDLLLDHWVDVIFSLTAESLASLLGESLEYEIGILLTSVSDEDLLEEVSMTINADNYQTDEDLLEEVSENDKLSLTYQETENEALGHEVVVEFLSIDPTH